MVETRRRGGDRTPQWREIEYETFMEVGHGARWYRREVGTTYLEPIKPGH